MGEQTLVLVGFIYSAMRFATPYLYAAVGETITQRSGVLNLGVEGVMLISAYTAFFVARSTGNSWFALGSGLATGLLMGLIKAYLSVSLSANQTISGIGVFMLGLGLSNFLYATTFTGGEMVSGFQPLAIPLLVSIPVFGEIFFNHNILVYGAFLIIPLTTVFLNKTRLGLSIRAVGQKPAAADSLGVDVVRTRYIAVCLGSILAGAAGASLSIGLVKTFQANMTGGIGFIAVALVYFGSWTPGGVLIGAMLLSTVNALQLYLQLRGVNIPSNLVVMLPYLLTLLALMFTGRAFQKNNPDALCQPFERGD